ncbi:MAG: hypothetical protein WC263_00345 [Candidatus Micrarchaeia archaeon]|jgi:hypothetical protein
MGGGGSGGAGAKGGPAEVPIEYGFSGEAWVVRRGSRMRLGAAGGGRMKLQDGDRLVTGNGFIWDRDADATPYGKERESSMFAVFPQSELEISILDFERKESSGRTLGQMVTRLSLVHGLFWVKITSADAIGRKLCLPQSCPQVEFKPDRGEYGRVKELAAFIGIDSGTLTVFSTHERVVHAGLGVEVRPESVGDGRVTATQSAVYLTNMVEKKDMRASLARKMLKYMLAGAIKPGEDAGGAGGEALYSLPPFTAPSEDEKVVKRQASKGPQGMDGLLDGHMSRMRAAEDGMVEKRLAREKAFNEEYEGAPEKVKAKAHKAIEKQNSEDYRAYSRLEREMREKLSDDQKKLAEAGRHGMTAGARKAGISGSVEYREVQFEFSGAERGTEMGAAKAKPGTEYLMLRFRVRNNSKKTAYMSPDEEFSLACGGETIPLKNYKFETAMDPGYSGEGHLLFVVPEREGSFTLRVGRKQEGKKELGFSA